MKSVMILGGPGNISESTVRYFINKGIPVATLTHATTNLLGMEDQLKVYRGDRNEEQDILHACNDFDPEVVIDFCCFEPFQAELAVKSFKKTKVRRYIFISTVDVYGYPLSNLPMRENDPWGEPNCKYASDKKICEGIFRSGFATGTPYLTIARPAYSMGKSFALSAFERNRGKNIVSRIREGKGIYVPGDGNALLQTGAAYNTGLMIARIAENDVSINKDYTCGHNTFNTQNEYIEAFAKVIGKPAKLVHIPTDFMFSLGRQEVDASILRDLTVHNLYFSVEKFKNDFPDFVWEYDIEDAARDFIKHQEEKGTFDHSFENEFEDDIVDLWESEMAALKTKVLNEFAKKLEKEKD